MNAMMDELRKLADDSNDAALNWAVERIETLEATLVRINAWCDAYPIEVFPKLPTVEQLKLADQMLAGVGISMTGMHGSWGRHILQGISDIIKPVLP